MQLSIFAAAAFVASAAAHLNQTYVTQTVTAYTTICPAATTIVHGSNTYTATANQTLTLTNGPYTIVKPVHTTSIVVCKSCPTGTASAGYPVYTNGTGPTYYPPGAPAPTLNIVQTFAPHSPTAAPTPLQANSGNKVFAFSGASLAALVGVAAFIL